MQSNESEEFAGTERIMYEGSIYFTAPPGILFDFKNSFKLLTNQGPIGGSSGCLPDASVSFLVSASSSKRSAPAPSASTCIRLCGLSDITVITRESDVMG